MAPTGKMLRMVNTSDGADARGLGMFFRYGYTHEDHNEIKKGEVCRRVFGHGLARN